ncbi:MAG: cytochrome c-type biogenesis protein [Anaerolineales bacterium]
MKRLALLTLFALVLIGFSTGRALAQEPQPTPSDDAVNAVAKELFCPVCENTPLDVCPTEACKQWRALIRQQLAEGKTKEEIHQYFVTQYGARVLSEPPREGLNWLVYVVPPVLFLVGAGILFSVFRSWKKPLSEVTSSDTVAPLPASDDEYIKRLEDELRKRD